MSVSFSKNLFADKPINRLEDHLYEKRKIKKTETLLQCNIETQLKENLKIKEEEPEKQEEVPVNINLIKQELEQISSIKELNYYTQNYSHCSLKNFSKNTVCGTGPVDSKLMIIGEAPGEQEDIESKPFVGKGGKLLRAMLKFASIDPEKSYITNSVFWRPENNRNPSLEELNICKPILEKRINLVNPDLILLVGSIAAKNFIETKETITNMRLKIFSISIGEKTYKAIVTFHPAFLLRASSFKEEAKKDMVFLKKYLHENHILSGIELEKTIVSSVIDPETNLG